MAIPSLGDFYLAGGTALALYYGHRLSIDIDLFSTREFNIEDIIPDLEASFNGFTYENTNEKVGLFAFIDDVKTDLVRYHFYKLIDTPIIEEGIRILSIKDIAAMKISAILKRGVKKDFWDIAELLKHFTVAEMTQFYSEKFPNQQLLISIPQALVYFDDAEDSEQPVSLKGQKWETVKKNIRDKVGKHLY